ncbi:hypothetical protein BDQ17DRAFT_13615 [Cyathus striatus]|nr:hypothetical protein BDQ17DRAFT_13615 [Cyathus striatus]
MCLVRWFGVFLTFVLVEWTISSSFFFHFARCSILHSFADLHFSHIHPRSVNTSMNLWKCYNGERVCITPFLTEISPADVTIPPAVKDECWNAPVSEFCYK